MWTSTGKKCKWRGITLRCVCEGFVNHCVSRSVIAADGLTTGILTGGNACGLVGSTVVGGTVEIGSVVHIGGSWDTDTIKIILGIVTDALEVQRRCKTCGCSVFRHGERKLECLFCRKIE